MSAAAGDEIFSAKNDLTVSTQTLTAGDDPTLTVCDDLSACDDLTLTAGMYTPGDITSSSAAANTDNQMPNSDEVWCYCREPEDEVMIACDFPGCNIEWFHMKCLRMEIVPHGNWYCPGCRIKFKGKHPTKNSII